MLLLSQMVEVQNHINKIIKINKKNFFLNSMKATFTKKN